MSTDTPPQAEAIAMGRRLAAGATGRVFELRAAFLYGAARDAPAPGATAYLSRHDLEAIRGVVELARKRTILTEADARTELATIDAALEALDRDGVPKAAARISTNPFDCADRLAARKRSVRVEQKNRRKQAAKARRRR